MDVELQPEWKGKPVFFVVREGIDDTDTFFVNGKEVGRTDEKTPNYWEAPRNYRIPENVLKFGEKNRLVVEVRNLRGEAGFGTLPLLQIGSAELQEPDELRVTDINYFSKEYTIGKGNNLRKLRLSLGTPFVRWTFPGRRSVELNSDGNSLRYGAIPQKNGIKIIDFRKQSYESGRDGAWNAPWMLLFSGSSTPSAPLLVVFEHPVAKIAGRGGNAGVSALQITAKNTLDRISAGYLFGAKKVATDGWEKKLPSEIVAQAERLLQPALNFPVGCDEVFRIDPQSGRVTVRNVFRYDPVESDWKVRMTPWAVLPPMVGFALREKLTVSCGESLADTGSRGCGKYGSGLCERLFPQGGETDGRRELLDLVQRGEADGPERTAVVPQHLPVPLALGTGKCAELRTHAGRGEPERTDDKTGQSRGPSV